MKVSAYLALGLLLAGCTTESKTDYQEAGQAATVAAKKTGEAIAVDAKAAGPKIKGAAAMAEKTAREAMMTAKVKAALLAASHLHAAQVSVETKGTTVTLSGTVPSAKDRTTAEELAKKTAGTGFTVRDNISVRETLP